ILIFSDDLVKKGRAGVAFIGKRGPDAHAGVNEQSQLERQIGLAGEVLNGLWTPVFLGEEVFFRKIADVLSLLIAHGCEEINYLDRRRKRGLGGIRSCGRIVSIATIFSKTRRY